MIWALAFDGGLQPLGGGVLAVFVGVALLSPVIGRPIVARHRRRLPAAVRHGRAAGQGERPAQPAAHRGDRVGADDRARAGHHDGGPRPVRQVQRRRTGEHRPQGRLRRVQRGPGAVLRRGRAADRRGAGVSAAVARSATAMRRDRRRAGLRRRRSTRRPIAGGRDHLGRPAAWTSAPTASLVDADRADGGGLAVGDTVTVGLPAGPRELTVVGIIAPSQRSSARTSCCRSTALEAGGVPPVDSIVYVTGAPGADPAAVLAGIDGVLADLPTVTRQGPGRVRRGAAGADRPVARHHLRAARAGGRSSPCWASSTPWPCR